jgi:GNAT superfamily N-acetyltransferase
MRDLPPGWATDLAVLELTGSTLTDHGDHLVVRSPRNPDYHWGNCLFVLDEDAVDDAARWVGTFRAAFPGAAWIAIGLPRMPAEVAAWTALGVDVELHDVLTTRTRPRTSPAPAGYQVRALAGDDDWAQSVRLAVRENALTGDYDAVGYERFAITRAAWQRDLAERGVAAWFGAFADGVLVADLGIVRCGTTARYQAVGTDDAHRRRGLATHLLGVAAQWAADAGCDRWVIVTEATNPAGRVYRGVGFELDAGNVQAYRPGVPG